MDAVRARPLPSARKGLKRRVKRRIKRLVGSYIAVVIVWTVEVALAALCGLIAALLVALPVTIARGHAAFGGEWVLVFAVTMLSYHFIHRAVFQRLE